MVLSRCRALAAAGAVAVLVGALGGCGTAAPKARTLGAAAARASAWPEAFSTAAHTSATTATGPRTGQVRWTRTLGADVNAGAAVGIDGSILASSDGGVLHALDPSTGADRWTFSGHGTDGGEDLSVTPAVLADGTILWPAPHHQLDALTAGGKLLWTQPMTGFVLSPALGTSGRVYVSDMSGDVTAIDTGADGAHHVAWTLATGGNSFGSPAVGPDGTIYTTAGQTLYAIQDDGTKASIRWRFTMGTQIEVSAAVAADGTVILGTDDAVVYGVSPAGALRWEAKTAGWSYSSPVVSGGKAYVGDNGGDLDVIDVASGKTVAQDTTLSRSQATSPAGVGIWTAPLVDAVGDVYFGTAAGHLYGFSPSGGQLWDVKTGGIDAGYPALTAGGLLIVGSGNGSLYAIG
jgi:outer membrane protein assembly factor BamB